MPALLSNRIFGDGGFAPHCGYARAHFCKAALVAKRKGHVHRITMDIKSGLACSAEDMIVIEEGSDSPPADTRSQQRSSMFLAAVLRVGTDQAPVKVRNMSPKGAMVESPLAPHKGMKVELMRGALVARGTVIWSAANKCGLRFSSEVSVNDWLAPSKVQQQRVDEIAALVKAGTNLGSDEEISGEARSHEQLVDDLAAVVRLMQDLEDVLTASDETLERHGMKLQNLDIAMQMVRAVAGELSSGQDMWQGNSARLKDLRLACDQALATR